MPATVVVPERCNGPLDSGNGGCSCGLFAGLLDGPAAVSLRSPVPLGLALDVQRTGDAARVVQGETLVAEVVPGGDLDLRPPLVTPAQARAAARGYRGSGVAIFDHCYVCGPAREDALGVFAGPVAGREVVASPWTPPAWAAGPDGAVRAEHVWAVMDCPTYFAVHLEGGRRTSLVWMQASIDKPVTAGAEHVVVSWPLGVEGRKHHAGAAVLGDDGAVLAVAQALLIEPR